MREAELIQALEYARGLPVEGPFRLTGVQDNVFKLTTKSGDCLLKWISMEDRERFDEIGVARTLIGDDEPLAPDLVFELRRDGGSLAAWKWLDGGDLRDVRRHLIPSAFAELGRFHLRRRHDGRVNSTYTHKSYANIEALCDAEQDALLPFFDASSRPRARRMLDRLRCGYATVIHGDMHAGNMIQTKSGIRFVDWSMAVPSLNFLDLEYIEGVVLEPGIRFWPYVNPEESESVLCAYSASCGVEGVDIRSIHLAVMLRQEVAQLSGFLQREPPDLVRAENYRSRLEGLIGIDRDRYAS